MPGLDRSAPEDIDSTLRAITEAYRARLPDRLQSIADSLAQCEVQPGAAHCDALVRHVHTLAGSAGTFGFTELGIRATELEIALNDFLANGPVNDPSAPDRFARIAADIHAFLAWARHDCCPGMRR